MTIDAFKNVFSGGTKSNLFEIYVPIPPELGNIPRSIGDVSRNLTLLCKAATLPPSNIGTITTFKNGRQIKFPGDRVFDPWTIQIICDRNFSVRHFFEIWSNMMCGRSTTSQKQNNISSDVLVSQLGKELTETVTYEMVGAFPVQVSEINISYDAMDQIEEFAVTFEYQYWDVHSIGSGEGDDKKLSDVMNKPNKLINPALPGPFDILNPVLEEHIGNISENIRSNAGGALGNIRGFF